MNWDEYFFNIVDAVALKSKDRSVQIGCVIVGPNKEIRSTGYNGFPRGVNDGDLKRYERPLKYDWTEHAERNAIYNAARHGTPLEGCIIYINELPCPDCARAIIQSGIKTVIIKSKGSSDPKSSLNNIEKKRLVRVMLKESGVDIIEKEE